MLDAIPTQGRYAQADRCRGVTKVLEAINKDDRQTAKAVNFGLIFGQRAKGLVVLTHWPIMACI